MLAAILAAAQLALGAYSMFKKKPKAPALPNLDEIGMSPEDEALIMSGVKRQVGEGVGSSLTAVREDMASRGTFRSGQLPKLETQIRTEGDTAIADAQAKLLLQKSAQKTQFLQYLTGLRENRYINDVNENNTITEAGGSTFGTALDKLLGMIPKATPKGRAV